MGEMLIEVLLQWNLKKGYHLTQVDPMIIYEKDLLKELDTAPIVAFMASGGIVKLWTGRTSSIIVPFESRNDEKETKMNEIGAKTTKAEAVGKKAAPIAHGRDFTSRFTHINHIERNYQNSPRKLKRGRNYSHSPSPHCGRSRCHSYYESYSYSRSRSPTRSEHITAEKRRSRSPRRHRSSPPPSKRREHGPITNERSPR
ncbi:hypothetical protein M9H77_30141 [Catharanthus roseus]|uniref:Uncharacterized protein n=1 Tax=Catharanthus roseus TaxID=4058 RepID=A0ACB9ZX89_CATRO|nr:hypothetical protein M9H77_30141 [Catharanthus roseus]